MGVFSEPHYSAYASWGNNNGGGGGGGSGNMTVVDKVLPEMLHMVEYVNLNFEKFI